MIIPRLQFGSESTDVHESPKGSRKEVTHFLLAVLFFVFSLLTIPSLAAATSIDDHVRNVCLDEVAIGVKVQQRKGPSLCGDTAGMARNGDVVGFHQIEDCSVEGSCHPRHTCQVHGAFAHAIIYLIALWLEDPVIPTNVPKIYIVVFSTAQF